MLNLVVQMEKDRPVHEADLLKAVGVAVLEVLFGEKGQGAWRHEIDLWEKGRIRKLVRRARGAKWEATRQLDHIEVKVGTAVVRGFSPCLSSEQPKELSGLQMSGTEALRGQYSGAGFDEGRCGLVVMVNPHLGMSSAKAAVQGAHACQLAAKLLSSQEMDEMRTKGWNVKVEMAVEKQWDEIRRTPGVVAVRDAGFTEIEPGSLTAFGWVKYS